MTTAAAPPERDWARIGLWLVGATMAYNVIEAGVALWFEASAESIALLGFGLDSAIECAAAGVLLWRLSLEARGDQVWEGFPGLRYFCLGGSFFEDFPLRG